MSEVLVPNFNTLDDFKSWARNLSDKEIQSWTTKDWLRVYEKIDAYVDGADFDKVYREKLPKLIDDGVFTGTIEQLTNHPQLSTLKRTAFLQSDEAVRNLMGNLYANYRFEPEHLKIIRKLGKKAGIELAKKDGIDLAAIAINTRHKTPDKLIKVMILSNNITIDQTNYKHDKHYKNWFSLDIDDKMEAFGQARANIDGTSKLVLNSKLVEDRSIQTSFHEAAHLHMQNKGIGQRAFLSNFNLAAINDLGSDFQKLMGKNIDYYVSSRSQKEYNKLYQGFLNIFDKEDARKLIKKDINRYHKQPVERFSEIYGIEAERAFRSQTGQYSERNAMKVSDILKEKTYLGKPQKALLDENGNINLIYKPDAEDIEEIFTKQLSEVDENIVKNINIVQNSDGTVSVYVSRKKALTNALNEYIKRKNTLTDALNDYINELNKRKNFVPTPSTNTEKQFIEELSAKKSVINSTKQPEIATSEKTATKSAMKDAAAKASTEIKQTTKAAGRTIKNTLLTVNKGYDAMFDRNVAKLMEMDAPQWMKNIDNAMAKPLNITAEQLQKAADAFMKTENGQKIAKKVAASYAKMGGKAMAASAAKKLPLICVGIACAMAKERYEKGEYVKAGLEVVSGVAACVPVFGTAVSLGIDAAVLLSDLKVFEHGVMPKDPNSHMAAESTFVEKPEIRQDKLVRKVDKAKEAKEKKKAEDKKKAQKFEANLYQYGGKPENFFGG